MCVEELQLFTHPILCLVACRKGVKIVARSCKHNETVCKHPLRGIEDAIPISSTFILTYVLYIVSLYASDYRLGGQENIVTAIMSVRMIV